MDKKYKLPNGDTRTVSPEEEEKFLTNNPGAELIIDDSGIPNKKQIPSFSKSSVLPSDRLNTTTTLKDFTLPVFQPSDIYDVDVNSSEFIDSTPNAVLTYENATEWFNSRSVYHDDPRWDSRIREKVYAGTHGFNPATGALIKLDEPVDVPSSDKELLTKKPKHMPSPFSEKILETEKWLEETWKFPMSMHDASLVTLPDGRILSETDEWMEYVHSIPGYELEDGSTGTYAEYMEDYSWWDWRRNLKNESIVGQRHFMTGSTPWYKKAGYPLSWLGFRVGDGIYFNNWQHHNDAYKPKTSVNIKGYLADTKNIIPKDIVPVDINDIKNLLVESNPRTTNQVTASGDTINVDAGQVLIKHGLPSNEADIASNRSDETNSKVNESTAHYFEQFGYVPNEYNNYTNGFSNIEETLVPYLQRHFNSQFKVQGYPDNFIKITQAKGIMEGGKDAVLVVIGEEDEGTVFDLNINSLKFGQLDAMQLEGIAFHINQRINPELQEDFLKFETNLMLENPDLIDASINPKSNVAEARYYQVLDEILGIEGLDIDGDGYRLIRRALASTLSGEDEVGGFARNISQGRFSAGLLGGLSAWVVDKTGHVEFTDRNGNIYSVPYSYLFSRRQSINEANVLVGGTHSVGIDQRIQTRNHEENAKWGGAKNRLYGPESDILALHDQQFAINKPSSRLAYLTKLIEHGEEGMFLNENGVLVELTGEEAETRLAQLEQELKEHKESEHMVDMFDEEGESKYQQQWIPHPEIEDMMLKVDLDGNPILDKNNEEVTMPYNISFDEDAILDLVIETDKNVLEGMLLEEESRILVYAELVLKNLDLVYDEVTLFEAGANRITKLKNSIFGGIKNEEDLQTIRERLERIVETGSLYDKDEKDGIDVLFGVSGSHPAAIALNDALISYRMLSQAVFYNVDPLEQHKERMFGSGVDAIFGQGFFNKNLFGKENYDMENAQDILKDRFRTNNLLFPERAANNDWTRGDHGFRNFFSMTTDVAGGLVPLVAEIRMFNIGGLQISKAMGVTTKVGGKVTKGLTTEALITKSIKDVAHQLKRTVGMGGKKFAKKYPWISSAVNTSIDIAAASTATLITWAAAENIHDFRNAHTLHRNRETGSWDLNWEIPVFMTLGGNVWGRWLQKPVKRSMDKAILKAGGHDGMRYILARDFFSKSFVKGAGAKLTPITSYVGGKVGQGVTATGLLTFASLSENFIKHGGGYYWNLLKDTFGFESEDSDEYKAWKAELFGEDGILNPAQLGALTLTMTVMGGKGRHGSAMTAVGEALARVKRHTKQTISAEKKIKIDKKKKDENGAYTEKDINKAAIKTNREVLKKIRKTRKDAKDGKISKAEAAKKIKKLKLESQKINQARKIMLDRNTIILGQEAYKAEKKYNDWVKHRFHIYEAMRQPLTAKTIDKWEDVNEKEFQSWLRETRLTKEQRLNYDMMFRSIRAEIETYKAHFGNENPKQKKAYLETIFERSQLETKIKSWEREIEKNPKQKDMLEKRIKKAKEKIKELDKKAEEQIEGFHKLYQDRVDRLLEVQKTYIEKLENLDMFEVIREVERSDGTPFGKTNQWQEALKKEGMLDTGGEAFISGDGRRIYVNATRMAKYRTIGSGGHELLHHIFWNALMKTTKWQLITKNKKGEEIIQEFTIKEMDKLKKTSKETYDKVIKDGIRVQTVSAKGRKLIEHLMKGLETKERELVEKEVEKRYMYETILKKGPNGKLGWYIKVDENGKPIKREERDYVDEKVTVLGDLIRKGEIKRTISLARKIQNVFGGIFSSVRPNAYKYDLAGMESSKAAREMMKIIEDVQSPSEMWLEHKIGAVGLTKRVRDVANAKWTESRRPSPGTKGTGSGKFSQAQWLGESAPRSKSQWNSIDMQRELGLTGKTVEIVAKNRELYQQVVERAKSMGLKPEDYKNAVTQEVRDGLVMNNLARVNALAKKAWEAGVRTGLQGEKLVSFEDFQSGYMMELVELARTWNPSKVPEFGAYMNSLLPKRYSQILEAAKGKGPETKSMTTEEGKTLEVEDSMMDIDAMVGDIGLKTKKPQYSKLRQDIKLDVKTMEVVQQAVVKTFGTKLPEVTSKEFKAELEKRFRVELKKTIQDLMGSRENYNKFLVEHFPSIFEALPVQTLIQMERNVKPENRIFTTSERITKPTEVDRLISEGLLPKDVSRTSGPQLHTKNSYPGTERVLAFFRGLNMENVLGYKVGASTLGTRKDVLAKEMGVELAFDATMEVIQRPDVAKKRSDILELQELEQLSNEAVIIAKQINRSPTGRFSNNSNWNTEFSKAGAKYDLSEAGVKEMLETLKPEQLKYDFPYLGSVLDAYARAKGTPAEINNKGYLDMIMKDPLLSTVFNKHGNFHRYKTTKKGKTIYNKKFMKKHFNDYVKEILKFIPKDILAREGTYKDGKFKGGHLIPGHQRFFANGLVKVGSGRSPNGGWSLKSQHEVISEYVEIASGRHKDVKPGEYTTPHSEKLWNEYRELVKKHGPIDLFESTMKTKEGANKLFEEIQKDGTTTQMEKAEKVERLYKAGSQKVNRAFAKAYLSTMQDYVNKKVDLAKPGKKDAAREDAIMHIIVDMYSNSNFTKGLRALAPGVGLYLPPGKAALKGKVKGEHGKDRARFDAGVTSSLMRGNILMDFNSLWYGYEQIRLPVELGNKLDLLGGRNNPQGAFRYMFEPSVGKNIYLPGEGKFLNDILTEKVSIEAAKMLSDSKVGHKNIRLAHAVAQTGRMSMSGKTRGASVFDFDDTMAYTKSGVRVNIPNPSGTPKPRKKVIFMAGGAGSGKGNVVNKLNLEKQGFKIVNQDISLEWLKKNHGLPEDMRDFTKEQKSLLGKLGHEARKIAKSKMMKYKGQGDGVVVDGTGGSIKMVTKLVNEFKNKGYDVSMLFVETTLKTALARNKARKERSLLDFIVKKNHEAVQGNKPGFKKLFGDRFMEIKTDKLTMESTMPKELVSKMDNFVSSYERVRLDATEFAAKGDALLKKGADFDFSEFNKVVEGVEGPYLKTAIEKAKKYGTKDLFVLTARPAESAGPIREFLRSQGLNIPLENITGLANSTGLAKAKWMLEKASEGYNDFYFVDDATQNVEAVKKALDQIDVKSKVIQAKGRFSNSMNLEFNNILERSSKGKIEAGRDISLAEARALGRGKGRFDYFVPPSAEDFRGLMYKLLGKGEQGNIDMRFFKKSLFDPFAKGIRDLTITKQKMVEEYRELKKISKNVKLNKNIEGTAFNVDAAVRVYLWEKAGHVIPDISPQLVRQLADYVKNRPELLTYAETLSSLSRSSEIYRKPGKFWMVESIASDLNQLVRGETRQKFLQEWIDNKNIIFSKENLNKLEAIHGKWYREALENMLYRMETGTNRISGKDGVTKWWYDWINGSVGATMFWNTRSAVLQTISMVNFTNMAENSVFHQAKAFANQPQFWKDFAFIMNSPMLKQRRGGLEIDVSASELTNMFENSGRNPKAILQYMLEKGFTPTRIADSFAIAMGGSGFYRNRVNMYIKKGLSEGKAKEKAWLDFQEIAERTQQSSRPDLISQQQAGPLGRIILAWQNTPMQMTRLMKKKLSDLVNRRKNEGQTQFQSDMANLSGILYYGAVQNLWFMTLQSGLAWLMFGSDMEDKIEQKEIQVLNGAFDTLLRGTGVYGAAFSTMKNTILRYLKEKEKPKWKRDQAYTVIEALNLSPPIGSKVRKAYSAIKTWEYNEGVGKELGFRIENPNFHAYANLIEAATNIPLARLLNKANNLEEAITGNHETWQRIAMISGWSKWNVDVKDEELEEAKDVVKEKKQEKQKIEAEKKKEEKKKEQQKLKEEEKKKEEQEKKEKGIKVVRCSGRNSSGKRCGLTTETAEKTWKCFHHGEFKDGGDRDGDGIKEYRCTGRTKSGKRCKNKGEYTGKKKRCYAHQ